ncbi:hypothetical protein [Escherichia coli]
MISEPCLPLKNINNSKDLNKMIIKPAIAELNEKSDLVVTVETIKKGRTVVALHFRFKEDKQIKMTI